MIFLIFNLILHLYSVLKYLLEKLHYRNMFSYIMEIQYKFGVLLQVHGVQVHRLQEFLEVVFKHALVEALLHVHLSHVFRQKPKQFLRLLFFPLLAQDARPALTRQVQDRELLVA